MTKEEIKLIKEQQRKLEDAYIGQIKALKQAVEEKDNTIRGLNRENTNLRDQIAHLQSGLTGEEIEYYRR